MKIKIPAGPEILNSMKIGENYELTGYIYTARDAAHKRFIEAMENGKGLPIDLKDQAIFYTGPCPPRQGMAIGSIGATTSNRMDPYVEPLLEKGLKIMIGKGTREDYISTLCKKYKAVYLLVYGGAAALYSKSVKTAEVAAYEDLGTEAVRKLYVEDFKVIVGTDTAGNVLQKECIEDYKK
jgi:fumarate hydratase subunit beta